MKVHCFAATWDVAANFNATDNPSASDAFSYGWGANPAAFALLQTISQNCFAASPAECLNNGNSFPGMAAMAWNGSGSTVSGGTVNVFPGFVNMDPQLSGGVILRFTAPWTDVYSMTGKFQGDDSGQHATIGSVYQNNTSIQSVNVNSYQALSAIGFSGLALSAGETIDFIVTSNSDCCFLSTGLAAVITSQTDGAAPEPGTLLLIPAALLILVRRARPSPGV